jgi:NADH:ubiquinone oxidoreductase subunit 5 (subunit L)/multisubunit Na+/H+ antiporter MnhA subunit
MNGINALYENYLKKVIALRQLGLMIIILRIKFIRILITYAVHKSSLFLCTGIIIYLIKIIRIFDIMEN